ncbi:hypothetical protein D3C75_393680 [compost metagenome]
MPIDTTREAIHRAELVQKALTKAIHDGKDDILSMPSYTNEITRQVWRSLIDQGYDVESTAKVLGNGHYSSYVDFRDGIIYHTGWKMNANEIIIDATEEVVEASVETPEKSAIELAFETLTAAMVSDPGYLWSWVCNTACPIIDAGVEHGVANKAAARVLANLFKVDVTQMPEYKDILARTSKEVVLPDTSVDDPEVNTIHITVTGFDSNSGAEALARHLDHILGGSGRYETKLNIADTTLTDAQRNLALPSLMHSVINITGVESRYHTDRVTAISEPEGEDVVTDEGALPECGYCGHPECSDCYVLEIGDPVGDVGLDEVCPTAEVEGKMVINLKIDDRDLTPMTTINFFRQAYPKADMNVDIKPDLQVSDSIAKKKKKKDTFYIGFDETTQDPNTMVEWVQQTYLDAQPPVDEQPTLANPDYRKNAYVFEHVVDGEKNYMVLHVQIDVEDFHPELFVGNGVRIAQVKDVEEMHSLLALAISLEAASHYVDLFSNNERWLNRFGDGTAVVLREHEGPFTLFNIAQDSIPRMIYSEVEDCWTAFQNVDRLSELAEKLNDSTIIIGVEDYLKVTRAGLMVVREHPRLEELFLKYLQYKAQFDPSIGRWLRSYGK